MLEQPIPLFAVPLLQQRGDFLVRHGTGGGFGEQSVDQVEQEQLADVVKEARQHRMRLDIAPAGPACQPIGPDRAGCGMSPDGLRDRPQAGAAHRVAAMLAEYDRELAGPAHPEANRCLPDRRGLFDGAEGGRVGGTE